MALDGATGGPCGRPISNAVGLRPGQRGPGRRHVLDGGPDRDRPDLTSSRLPWSWPTPPGRPSTTRPSKPWCRASSIPADLEQANGILTGTESGAENLVGPVVGTWLFAIGKSLPFLADAFSLLVSCFPFIRFRSKVPTPQTADRRTPFWKGSACCSPTAACGSSCSWWPLCRGSREWKVAFLSSWPRRNGVSGRAPYGLFLATGALGALIGSFVADGAVRRGVGLGH